MLFNKAYLFCCNAVKVNAWFIVKGNKWNSIEL